MKTRRRLPELSIQHLWPLATLFVIFFFLGTHPVRPHDFWWHLRAGEQIVTTGRIPSVDTFSYTMAGQPYDSYASFWIVESAYYLLYSLGGLPLLITAHAIIITLAYGLVLWLCRRASGSWRVAAAGTIFAVALGVTNWNLRPQDIAFLLGALYLWAIYEHRWRPRPWLVAVFPLGMLLWVNSHGSFIVGLLMLGIWLIGEGWQALRAYLGDRRPGIAKRLVAPALALATSALACLANPRGFGIITYVQSLSSNPVIRNLIAEWVPPSFRSSSGVVFLVGLLVAATLLAVSPRRPTLFQVLSFLGFAVLGFQGVRFAAWFGMVMAPVVAEHLAATVDQARAALRSLRRSRTSGQPLVSRGSESVRAEGAVSVELPRKRAFLAINWLLAGMLLLGAVLSTPWLKHILPLPPNKAGLVSAETPVEATRFLLQQRPPGRLFNEMGFGSYLIWAAPEYPVFVDPRIELYPTEVWEDYFKISTASVGWEETLDRYGVNTLLLSPAEQPYFVQAVEQSQDWRPVYRDPGAVLFVRVSPSS